MNEGGWLLRGYDCIREMFKVTWQIKNETFSKDFM